MQETNAQIQNINWGKVLIGALMTIITLLLAGTFAFLWSVNGTISRIEERDANRTEAIKDIATEVKEIKLNQAQQTGELQQLKGKVDVIIQSGQAQLQPSK